MTSQRPLIEACHLDAGYGATLALQGIDFDGLPHQRIGVLGPNGGGKTTLFKVLLGELAPVRGRVIAKEKPGLVPQTERSRLDYPVSALDVALMGALADLPWWKRPGRVQRDRARGALASVGLAPLASAQFGELSGGQRQRVLIARALMQDAKVLLLDEPFAGLDEPSAAGLMDLIDRLAAEGCCVMIATHDIDQVRRWDAVLCLNRRQFGFGPPGKVLTRLVLEATYDEAIVMLPQAADTNAMILPAHHHPEVE